MNTPISVLEKVNDKNQNNTFNEQAQEKSGKCCICYDKGEVYCTNCDQLHCRQCDQKLHLNTKLETHFRVEKYHGFLATNQCEKHRKKYSNYCNEEKKFVCVGCINDVCYKKHHEKVVFLDNKILEWNKSIFKHNEKLENAHESINDQIEEKKREIQEIRERSNEEIKLFKEKKNQVLEKVTQIFDLLEQNIKNEYQKKIEQTTSLLNHRLYLQKEMSSYVEKKKSINL
eukprot:Anaeramoba_flamelloidesa585011_29.p1 GENE.a585011_29~~a585011_29.p1  ORF type:complete len:229 (+),score=60.38 a585011_29:1-687(+)